MFNSHKLQNPLDFTLQCINIDHSKESVFDRLDNPNTLVALQDGCYMLCSINSDNLTPPDRNVKVYLSKSKETLNVDIVDVFKVVQQSTSWSEIN